MTSPIEEFMPYGMTFQPTAGSSYVGKPATSSPHISGQGLALPSAPVTVSASWTGAEECGVYLSRSGVLSHIGTIPAKSGGGSVLPSLPSSGASRATSSTSTVDQPGTAREVQLAPLPSYPQRRSIPGGGLDDHAARGLRVHHAVRDHCNSSGDGDAIPARQEKQFQVYASAGTASSAANVAGGRVCSNEGSLSGSGHGLDTGGASDSVREYRTQDTGGRCSRGLRGRGHRLHRVGSHVGGYWCDNAIRPDNSAAAQGVATEAVVA